MSDEPRRLDFNQKQEVSYCIPNWLRDEQIKLAVARVKGRIQPHYDRRDDPIAVVGFGPSLQDTWEQIKPFKYVITCSGSHRFLIDRGIIPNWHVEVDPRDHKIGLLGQPHPDVEYLPSSTCHPKYFDHLEGYNVKLWHVFDATADGLRLLPPGEWAITGGCDVGMRAMTIAAFFGFRDLHMFGFDGCARNDERHAAYHPHGKQKYSIVTHDGVDYLTTPGMLAAAQQILHELDQMPNVTATFYGQGLIQAITKGYVRKTVNVPKALVNNVAYSKPELISTDYATMNRQLHHDNLAYGVGGGRHAKVVTSLADSLHTTSILDYGCGKGYLAKELPFPIWEYDPAIPGKDTAPRPADIVVCTDVLEHIEPDKLFYVLDDIRRCLKQVGYFVIHTGPAQKTLPDGRNTHLIQQGANWWRTKLSKFFVVGKIAERGPELHIIVGAKAKKQGKAA